MKRFLFPLVASVSALSAHDDWSLNSHLFFNGEFVYIRRSELNGHNIVSDSNKTQSTCPNSCPDYQRLNTKKIVQDEFWFEPGYRIGLIALFDKKNSVEGGFMILDEWKGKKSVQGTQSLSFPFDDSTFTQDFVNANIADAYYESLMWTAEANYWRFVTPRRVNYFSVAWLIGLRFFEIDESFRLSFFTDLEKGSYDVHTKSYLSAAQVGGNFQINPSRRFTIDLTAKVGGGINYGKNQVFLGDQNNTVTIYNFETRGTAGAFVTNVEASLGYQIGQHLNIHTGYEFIYLSGTTLAPNQLDKSSNPSRKKFNSDGKTIFHGLFAGIMIGF